MMNMKHQLFRKMMSMTHSTVKEEDDTQINLIPESSSILFRILTFVLSSVLVFVISFALGLLVMECCECYENSKLRRSIQLKLRRPPPPYDSIIRCDEKTLPSYEQACAQII